MLVDSLVDTQQYSVQMRARGQVTIPSKVRDALDMGDGDTLTLLRIGDAIVLTPQPPRTYELADRIANMMDEEGVSMADLLADLPTIREELFQERYGKEDS